MVFKLRGEICLMETRRLKEDHKIFLYSLRMRPGYDLLPYGSD